MSDEPAQRSVPFSKYNTWHGGNPNDTPLRNSRRVVMPRGGPQSPAAAAPPAVRSRNMSEWHRVPSAATLRDPRSKDSPQSSTEQHSSASLGVPSTPIAITNPRDRSMSPRSASPRGAMATSPLLDHYMKGKRRGTAGSATAPERRHMVGSPSTSLDGEDIVPLPTSRSSSVCSLDSLNLPPTAEDAGYTTRDSAQPSRMFRSAQPSTAMAQALAAKCRSTNEQMVDSDNRIDQFARVATDPDENPKMVIRFVGKHDNHANAIKTIATFRRPKGNSA